MSSICYINFHFKNMARLYFPTLYLVTKLGKRKLWRVYAEENTFVRQDYFVGGKEKDPVVRVCETTNEGKINERTPEQQAEFEAAREWVKILSRGYQPDEGDEEGVSMYKRVMDWKSGSGGTIHNIAVKVVKLINGEKVDESTKNKIEKGYRDVRPMLASKLKDCKKFFDPKKDVWYAQYKLDGVRCIAQVANDGRVILTTRNCKEFTHLNHIREALKELLGKIEELNMSVILDGELYSHSLFVDGEYVYDNTRFNKISGACRPVRKKAAPYENQIQFHVFDIVDESMCQTDRFIRMQWLCKLTHDMNKNVFSYIKFVPSKLIKSVKDVAKYQELWVEKGYEGVILRRGSDVYEESKTSSRPKFLLKYKEFDDDEFVIVKAKDSKGTEKGCVVWVCETEDGDRFDVRPRGTFDERKEMYINREDYIGKMLTVRYQGVSEDNVPRFPIGIAIRDYE